MKSDLIKKIESLPENLQKEVESFIECLKLKADGGGSLLKIRKKESRLRSLSKSFTWGGGMHKYNLLPPPTNKACSCTSIPIPVASISISGEKSSIKRLSAGRVIIFAKISTSK